MVKKLRNLHNTTISQREKDYRQRLRTVDSGGDVELFT